MTSARHCRSTVCGIRAAKARVSFLTQNLARKLSKTVGNARVDFPAPRPGAGPDIGGKRPEVLSAGPHLGIPWHGVIQGLSSRSTTTGPASYINRLTSTHHPSDTNPSSDKNACHEPAVVHPPLRRCRDPDCRNAHLRRISPDRVRRLSRNPVRQNISSLYSQT